MTNVVGVLADAQALVMSLATAILIVVAWGFRTGAYTADVRADLNTHRATLDELEIRLQAIAAKQSDIESRTTVKVGALELIVRELRTELTMHAAQTERDHARLEREITELYRRVNHTP